MSTGKGIAIPTPKKPIQAIGKFTLAYSGDPAAGLHLSCSAPTEEALGRGLRSWARSGQAYGITATDPEPQPEPETRAAAAKKTLSPATIAKMRAAQLRRQAEARKAKEAATHALPATKTTTATKKPVRKEREKTMTAGSAA